MRWPAQLFTVHADELNHIHFGNLWNKLGKQMRSSRHATELRETHKMTLATMLERTITRLPECDAQALSNIAHGVANVGQPGGEARTTFDALFGALAAQALVKVSTFNTQDLANTVAAFASAGVEAGELFAAIALAIPPHLGAFKPQEIANTAWAYASTQTAAPELFLAIAAAAPRRLRSFRAQDLADVVWSFTKVGVAAPELFAAIAAEATPKRLRDFHAPELTSMAWAFAQAGVAAPELFEGISHEVRRKVRDLTAQEMHNLLWAFGALGVQDLELITCVAKASPKAMASSAKPEGLANLLLTLSSEASVLEEPGLYDEIASATSTRLHEMEPPQVSSFFLKLLEGSHVSGFQQGQLAQAPDGQEQDEHDSSS